MLAEQLRPLVAAYCRRPAVRHELGLDETTPIDATVLAEGAYHLNYLIQADDGRRWVARLSTGSPLGLSSSKQIAYEARVLRFLEPHRLAPHVCYVDATLYHLPYGFMVIEHLPGGPLDPVNRSHIQAAAELLARLHTITVPADHDFARNDRPLGLIVAGAEQSLDVYIKSDSADPQVTAIYHQALTAAQRDLVHESRFRPTALTHNNLDARAWRVEAARPVLTIGTIGAAPRPRLSLLDWKQARLDDPSADLARFLASVAPVGSSDLFLGAYLAARPDLDAADLRERVALRLKYEYLQTISRAMYAPADAAMLETINQALDPISLRSMFGDWLA